MLGREYFYKRAEGERERKSSGKRHLCLHLEGCCVTASQLYKHSILRRNLPLHQGSSDPLDYHLSTVQQFQGQGQAQVEMATGELEPKHYPTRRAATVALHYINVHHGSPFRVFGLQQVHKSRAEDVPSGGRKYTLDFSVIDWASAGSVVRCSADVFFPAEQSPPEVQCNCEALQQHNTTTSEEAAFYQKYRAPDSTVSGHDIPDSYGNVTEEMKPFWHLGRAAASFIMLKESSENTEYNMAQVASVTQQESQDKQLVFKYHVLLHDIVSQEIIHWKLLASWSPGGGIRVSETEMQPKCVHSNIPATGTIPAEQSSAK